MDFFQRIADAAKSARPRKDDPLTRFQKYWSNIEGTLSDFSGKLGSEVPPVERTDIPINMEELVKILLAEDHAGGPEDPTGPW